MHADDAPESPKGHSGADAPAVGAHDAEAWAMVETSPDGMILADDQGVVLRVNAQIEALFGYSRDELVGRPVEGLLPLRTREAHIAHRDAYRNDPRPRAMGSGLDLLAARSDGSEFPVEVSLAPLQTESGLLVVATVREISERLQAEGALKASEEAFRTAFNAAPVGIALVDFTDTVLRPISDCNAALCELLGYTRDELCTKSFAELTHPDDSETSDAAAQQAADGTRTSYAMEKRYLHADGHPVWVWVHSAVLSDDEGNPTRGMVHVADLTERKAAEAEREQARRWLAGLAEIRAGALEDDSIQRTLELVCRHARGLIGAGVAVIAQPSTSNEKVVVVAVDRPETEELVPMQCDIDDALRRALDGEVQWIDTLETEPGTNPQTRSTVAIPIRGRDRVESLLILCHLDGATFADSDVALVQTFMAEASTVLQLHAARRAQSELLMLQDRERLARDLHDLVIQRLFASGMALQSVLPLAKDPSVSDRITKTVEQLDETISELRSAIFALNTPESKGCVVEIEAIVEQAAEQLGFRPELVFDGDPDRVPGRVLEHLYPTLIEALSNVARHAQASAVGVTLRVHEDSVVLRVVDDGVGVSSSGHGHGMRNLESRAQRLDGTTSIENRPEGGAALSWTARF